MGQDKDIIIETGAADFLEEHFDEKNIVTIDL